MPSLGAHTVYGVFLLFFVFSTLGRLYLSIRQGRTVLQFRNRVPEAFAATVTPEEQAKAADYALAKQRLSRYEILFQAVLLLFFTWGGGLDLLTRISAVTFPVQPVMQGVLLIGLFAFVCSVAGWPFEWYRTFRLEARFGFNATTPATFVADRFKGMLLAVVMGVPLLFAVLWLMAAAGTLWWWYVWLLWVGFSLLLMWVFPKWIAPLFNKFEPLADPDLRTRIDNLLQRTGFRSNGIFVMDGSKRSGHGNAYFTGMGRHKRIVFFDTLLKDMKPEEVEAVLAHELGHFAHKHIIKQMAATFLLSLVLLSVLGWLLPQPGFYTGLGVHYPGNAQALLLFVLVLPVMTFPFSPLSGLMSRRNEFEADRFAARHAQAQHLISALTRLYRSNSAVLVSDKWYARFYDSHPGANERIAALSLADTDPKARV